MLSPEFKFVTDLAQALLAEYGEDLDTNDGGAQLQWRHPSGDIALNLTTLIEWGDGSEIVGGKDIFQYVIFDRHGETRADTKTLITEYPTTATGKITLKFVEYMASYEVVNGQAYWKPQEEITASEASDGDLAWFDVGLRLMEANLKSKK